MTKWGTRRCPSGRSLVAHSTALIFDVLGHCEVAIQDYVMTGSEKESRLVQDLYEIYKSLNKDNINEYYNDLIEKKRDTLQLFTYGVLSLEQRAKAEDLFRAIATKIVDIAKGNSELEDIRYALEQELSDSVRDIVREVKEDVRETVRSLREELTWAARTARRPDEQDGVDGPAQPGTESAGSPFRSPGTPSCSRRSGSSVAGHRSG